MTARPIAAAAKSAKSPAPGPPKSRLCLGGAACSSRRSAQRDASDAHLHIADADRRRGFALR